MAEVIPVDFDAEKIARHASRILRSAMWPTLHVQVIDYDGRRVVALNGKEFPLPKIFDEHDDGTPYDAKTIIRAVAIASCESANRPELIEHWQFSE
jgi:hypothetical protein